jgi:hypothetical protein
VDEVIRNLDVKKCPGPDGIDGIIIKRLLNCLPTFWLSLFNKCFLLGCFPKIWKEATVIAIPKSDKTKLHSVQGYRGISLLSIPGKCLEKSVLERLNYFLEFTAQLSPQQYGFTAGRSMADAIKSHRICLPQKKSWTKVFSPGTGHSWGFSQCLAPRNPSSTLETTMSPKYSQYSEGLLKRARSPSRTR